MCLWCRVSGGDKCSNRLGRVGFFNLLVRSVVSGYGDYLTLIYLCGVHPYETKTTARFEVDKEFQLLVSLVANIDPLV